MTKKYLVSLMMKSAQLQAVIDAEQKRRAPDTFRLLKLKKIRLAIKDRIQRLADGQGRPFFGPKVAWGPAYARQSRTTSSYENQGALS